MAAYSPVDPMAQRQADEQQLRYLTIANYVYAALNAVGVLMVAAVLLFASGIIGMQRAEIDPEALPILGLVGGFAGFLAVVVPLTVTVLQFAFARALQTRRHYTFCVVMAVLTCLSVPIGTVIGVLTLLVLLRPSAKMLFEERSAAAYPGGLAAPSR